MEKKKLAILGSGYLSQIVARAYKNNLLPEYELVGVFSRNTEQNLAFAKYFGCKACSNIDELMDLKPEFTVEAASKEAMQNYAEKILRSGSHLVVISTGVFSDSKFYEKLKSVAIETNQKVYIAHGSVGGFDILRTASLMGPFKTSFTSKKSPRHLYYTPVYREGLMDIEEPVRVYSAPTKDAVKTFPHFYNVAMAAALASNDAENMVLNIDAVPNFRGDDYRIQLASDQLYVDLNIYSSNYSVSGWSIVSVLRNAVSPFVY